MPSCDLSNSQHDTPFHTAAKVGGTTSSWASKTKVIPKVDTSTSRPSKSKKKFTLGDIKIRTRLQCIPGHRVLLCEDQSRIC